MHTGTINVRDLFGQERRHVVPLFQRPYVWCEENQWQPLWEDLLSLADRRVQGKKTRPHFLGAIVLDQVPKPTGHVEVRLVIDGQQRLTTIQLLLTAFRDVCGALGYLKHQRSMEKLTVNDDPLQEREDEAYKVWPTNADQAFFLQVMKAGDPKTLCKQNSKKGVVSTLEHPVLDAYLFFCNRIQAWLEDGDEDGQEARLEALFFAVREHLRLVVIDLEREDDAQLIFETLNARGTPLLPSDLVKNHLFHQAHLEERALDPLYQKYWKGFDDESKFWREELGRGHAKRARIDTFLQFYLTVRLRDEVGAGHLYTTFRDQLMKKGDDTEQHLASLQHYSDVYRSFPNMPTGSAEARFFERLGALGLTSPYPFLMDLFMLLDDRVDERREILRDIESFLVRRMICQLTTRGYNRFFIELLNAFHGEVGTEAERVRAFLASSTAETARWPSDEEFRQAWQSVPAFRVFTQGRVRMVLEAIERRIRTGKSEALTFEEKLTIEHLMPQKWDAYWPLPSEADPAEARATREELMHTMGNLTLVTQKLNPALSNGSWEAKRPEILKHSALALNRELVDVPRWDSQSIQDRGKALFGFACKEWSRSAEN